MNEGHPRSERIDRVVAGAPPDAGLLEHLASCERCSAELRRKQHALTRIDDVLRDWMRVSPPGEFTARVHAATLRASQRPRHAWWPRRSAAAFAAVCAVLAIAVAIYHERSGTANTLTVVTWQSPTALLLRPPASVLNIHTMTGGTRAL